VAFRHQSKKASGLALTLLAARPLIASGFDCSRQPRTKSATKACTKTNTFKKIGYRSYMGDCLKTKNKNPKTKVIFWLIQPADRTTKTISTRLTLRLFAFPKLIK
jgi:hypothetical protein